MRSLVYHLLQHHGALGEGLEGFLEGLPLPLADLAQIYECPARPEQAAAGFLYDRSRLGGQQARGEAPHPGLLQ
jgi:hypothetical protein